MYPTLTIDDHFISFVNIRRDHNFLIKLINMSLNYIV